jgi:hypothetical protein
MANKPHQDPLVREAKAIVALSFRNGPIEDVHAGGPCPVCHGKTEYSHITQDEMKLINEGRSKPGLQVAPDEGG